jgi:hypothetical protein
MAEWTITIDGRNEFGDKCRMTVRIDKSWQSMFHGDIGLSIGDGKKILSTLHNDHSVGARSKCPLGWPKQEPVISAM